MAIVNTDAIVFSSIKYGDTSLIVRCFTREEGVKSYLLKGVLKSKRGKLKTAYFQPLTQLRIIANHNTKNKLNSIREAQVVNAYNTIYTSIIKQTIVLFLAEVLTSIIQEEEKNEGLYLFLETSFLWLDTNEEVSNFHLLFLVNLTRFLGFYPDTSASELDGFDLVEGCFTFRRHEKNIVTGSELLLFKSLLGINFDRINGVSLHKKERQVILQTIIKYFELHLEGFRKPKSLDILETVFS